MGAVGVFINIQMPTASRIWSVEVVASMHSLPTKKVPWQSEYVFTGDWGEFVVIYRVGRLTIRHRCADGLGAAGT